MLHVKLNEKQVEYLDNKFNFCNCGDPTLVWNWVISELIKIQARFDESVPKEIRDGIDKEFCNATAQQHFLWYWFDEQGLTEHGGSVYGAWIDEKGIELLKELHKLSNL